MTTMKKKLPAAAALVLVLVLVLAGEASAACNAGSLVSCVGPITGGGKPSRACCSNLKAQQGCLCQFAKNPAYGRYVNSPNARKTLASCAVAVPRC